jgi:serine/threonine-protein kinase
MLDPDQLLGSYKLISRIGAGGMGEVWKAEDTRLGRAVAIKILPARIASDTEAIARMRREARTAAQLNHPNIATIHSFEEAEGRTFIVMEFVAGEPLSALIQGGSLTEADVCRIGRNVAEALAEAHEKGIVHRARSRHRDRRPPDRQRHRPRDPSRPAERSRPAAHSGGLRTGSRPSRRNGTAASAAPRVQAVTS